MRKMTIALSVVIITASVFVILKYLDYLPPRTPLKIARMQSNLNIPHDARVIDFKEEYSFTGEGYIYILMGFNDAQFAEVATQSLPQGYRAVTIDNLVADGFMNSTGEEHGCMVHGKDITLIKEGYYRLKKGDLAKHDYTISILDKHKKEITVYVSIP
jgi:hypothetical protein